MLQCVMSNIEFIELRVEMSFIADGMFTSPILFGLLFLFGVLLFKTHQHSPLIPNP